MNISILRHLVIVGVSSFLFGSYVSAEQPTSVCTSKPVSLRMLKDIDFLSAFDSIYMHAVALDELDALPAGFIRVWCAIKNGERVVDLKDFIAALPILYEELLLQRSCAVSETSSEDRITRLESRLDDDEETLLEMMSEFESRLKALEVLEH